MTGLASLPISRRLAIKKGLRDWGANRNKWAKGYREETLRDNSRYFVLLGGKGFGAAADPREEEQPRC